MRKTKRNPLLLACMLVALLGIWSGCQRCDDPADPACRNYDPCYEVGPVSAKFNMFEKTRGWHDRLPIHKTLNAWNSLILEAEQELDSYEWYVGDEATPRTGRTITIQFGGNPYGRIPIKLIVKGKPNLACDPNDDGIDSVQKEVFVTSVDDLPIQGRFKGRNTHLPDETPFEVEILIMPEWKYLDTTYYPLDPALLPAHVEMRYYIRNFPRGTPNAAKFNNRYGADWTKDKIFRYRPMSMFEGGEGFFFTDQNGGGQFNYFPEGYGYLSSDYDSLTIHYGIVDSNAYWKEPLEIVNADTIYTFIGIRQ